MFFKRAYVIEEKNLSGSPTEHTGSDWASWIST